jgi:Hydantoinase B/oxoprolinase
VFDFDGTGCEVRGNLNAPISVVHSAVIYCMRAMLDVDIPLNAGCLVPLDSNSPFLLRRDFVELCGSPDTQGHPIGAVTYCGSLWRECTDITAHRRRRTTSIPCLRG